MSIPSQMRKHRRQFHIMILITAILLFIGVLLPNPMLTAIALFVINLYTFFLMAQDKRNAAHSTRFRIPEKSLYLLGLCFGSIGLVFGMLLFRHKTQKGLFRLYYLIALIHVTLIILYF